MYLIYLNIFQKVNNYNIKFLNICIKFNCSLIYILLHTYIHSYIYLNLFFLIKKENLDEVIKNYDDQLKEIYDIYTCENIKLVTGDSNEKKKKKNSTKEIKYKFIIFSIGIGVLFIMPFLSIMVYIFS